MRNLLFFIGLLLFIFGCQREPRALIGIQIIAYSREGYSNKQWVMPEGWKGVKSLDLYEISINGLEPVESGRKIENGRLELTLDKDQAVSIVPSGFKMEAQ